MKKYKLLIWYPTLPKDWEVGMEVGQGDRGMYSDYSPTHGKYSNNYVNHREVQNNPEFWEEVKPKEYKILSVCTNSYFGISKSAIDIQAFEESAPSASKYSIESVKRLSDGEVFTVGDICSPIGKESNNIHPINKIWICDPGYLRLSSVNYSLGINDIQKAKKPLFTTKDGKDVYITDSYYLITADWKICYCSDFSEGDLSFNCFSTKEAAEEYVLMNKPCLSITDINRLCGSRNISMTDLTNLVKKRCIE
jgi:hypothetical protein